MAELLVKTVKEWKEMSGQAIADEIKTFYKDDNFKSSEEKSWSNSLPKLVEVIDEAGFGDLMLVVEFELPIVGKRPDAVLLGNRKTDKKPFALIIELKKWSLNGIEIKGEKILVRGNDGLYEDAHPIYRTEDYLEILKHNFTNVNNGKLEVEACQYLHNFDRGDKEALLQGVFEKYKDKADRLFCEGEEAVFKQYIKNLFKSSETDSKAKELLENGEFCYSEEEIAIFKKIAEDPECIELMADQLPIKEKIEDVLKQLFCDRTKLNKQMIIISGSVGTGKTYVGFYILSRFFEYYRIKYGTAHKNSSAVFTTVRNKTYRTVVENCNYGRIYFPYLFKLYREKDETRDILIVDEAHRIKEEELKYLKVAKIVVILQDDRQRLLKDEVGTRETFNKFAEENKYELFELELTTQKRCGLSNYVDKIDNLLYNDEIKNPDPDKNNGIDITICNTLEEFKKCFDEKYEDKKNEKEKSIKYFAPLCWDWQTESYTYYKERDLLKLNDDENIPINYDIEITDKTGEYQNQWHPKGSDNLIEWYKKSKLVGCVFNAQGLGFAYVALIWWKDLKWDKVNSDWIINFNEIKDSSYSDEFKKSDSDEDKAKKREIVLNTYRILLTRAKYGIYIWFVDEDTKEHFKEVMGL